MLAYPDSIIGYFILGVAGACTFMFLMLMFDKDVAILRNQKVGLSWMILVYALLGGVVSAVVNIASNPEFGASQMTLAFSAGMGWPALATGISATKKVGDVTESAEKKNEENKAKIIKIEEFKQKEREEFIKNKLAEFDDLAKKAEKLHEKELERVKDYYLGKLSGNGGE